MNMKQKHPRHTLLFTAVSSVLLSYSLGVKAQIIADPNAPGNQQPTILQTPNGRPLVNIQTPSTGGVSRNSYSQFDVQQQGVILNNSRTATQSQLGGWVQGNPWLNQGEARIILNQVNSNLPSHLNGYLEVAGQRAEVVIANPAGIAVNGGGFINASRATLTTGTPILQGGNLDYYRVQRGLISITGKGLDTSQTDYTQLLARAVELNAGVWAKDLQVITGNHDVAHGSGNVTQVRQSGGIGQPASGFALDVAHLGGMYAGKITLVGTEAGLGVRNAGHIGASAGQVSLTSEGQLVNTGSILAATHESAPGHLTINARDGISNEGGTLYAEGNAQLSTRGDIRNTQGGMIAARGNADLAAAGASSRIIGDGESTLVAGLTASGALDRQSAPSNMALQATQAIQLQGQNLATGQVQLEAGSLDLTDSQTSARRILATALDGDARFTGAQLNADEALQIQALQTLYTNQADLMAPELLLQAYNLDNTDGSIIQTGTGNLELHLSGNLINTGGYLATNSEQLSIQADQLDNTDGQIIATQNAQIQVQQTLDNTQGLISANQSLALEANRLTNVEGLIQSTQAGAHLTVAEHLANTGQIQAETRLQMDAGTLDNSGNVYVYAGDLQSDVAGLVENSGLIAASGNAQLSAGQLINHDDSILAAGLLLEGGFAESGSLNIQVDGSAGLEGQLLAAGNLTLDAGQNITLQAAELLAGVDLVLASAGSLLNQGIVQAVGQLQLSAAQFENAAAASLTSNSHATLDISGKLTNAGQILALGSLELNAASLDNLLDAEIAATQAQLTIQGELNNHAKLNAIQLLDIKAGSLVNRVNAEITSGNTTQVDISGIFTNRGLVDGVLTRLKAVTLDNIGTGRIYGDFLAIAATTLKNRRETVSGKTTDATIAARQRLDIGVRTLNNEDSLIFSGGDIHIGGALDENWQATGEANKVTNASATIEALGNLTLSAKTLTNTNVHLITREVQTLAPTKMKFIRPEGKSDRIPVEELIWQKWSRAGQYGYRGDPEDDTSGVLGLSPIPQVSEDICEGETEETEVCTKAPGSEYLRDDPAWTYFKLTPPDPEPEKPQLLMPIEPDPAGAAACDLDAVSEACVAYTQLKAQYELDDEAYRDAWDQYAVDLASWKVTTQDRYDLLEARIEVYNDSFASRKIRSWTEYVVTRTEWEDEVVSSKPAQILSGGDMTLNSSGSMLNYASHIIAGGALIADLKLLDNQDAKGTRRFEEVGTSQFTHGRWRGGLRRYHQRVWKDKIAHTDKDSETINLSVVRRESHANFTGTGHSVAGQTGGGDLGSGADGFMEVSVQGLNPQDDNGLIRTSTPNATPPTASLYTQKPDPSASYLVETDPRFASYKDWLGSDYMLDKLKVDGDMTQKRLGDGFYEQRLIREQINQVTGQNLLVGYANEEEQYRALMDAGIAFAQEHQLIPGVALTAEQMAQLTSDLVWLVEQEVTLADGSTQKVLVPQVYVRVNGGDITGDGTLIAGNSLELNLTGDLTNSGTLAGRTSVDIKADSINNLGGRLQGADLSLNAQQDINNLGGQFRASNSMDITAGRDINIASTTYSYNAEFGPSNTSRTSIDSIAGLYLGNGAQGGMSLSAGNNLSVVGAEIINEGQYGTLLQAEGDVTITSLELERTENQVQDKNNFSRYTSTQNYGSTLNSNGDLTIQAGGTAWIHASNVNAEGTLGISADDIAITAGIDQESLHERSVSKTSSRVQTYDGGFIEQTAASSSLSGNNIQLQANNTIRVSGSSLDAQQDLTIGNLTVEQQDDGSFKAINGEGTPDQLIVDTLALTNESWSEHTTSYRGMMGDIMKGVGFVTGVLADTVGMDAPKVIISESNSQRTTTTTHQGSELNAGNDMVLAASDDIHIIAGTVNAGNRAVMAATNVTLDAAEEKQVTETRHSETSVSGSGLDFGKDEITLASGILTDQTTTERTTSTSYQGTEVNSGSLYILSEADLKVLGSQINVREDAVLQAENILVGGYEATTVTETHQETETTTVSVGVRNAYVDAALAVQALYEAVKAVDDAKDAYNDAKKRVDRGELAESALKDYEINLAATTAGLAQAQIAVGGAIGGAGTAAAGSMGTGFYASFAAQTSTTETHTTKTEGEWRGSGINVGGNLTLDGTNATIQGSDITAAQLNLNTENTLITAGTQSSSSQTESTTTSANASFGTNGNGSVGVSAQKSESQSNSTQHVNSRISVGHLTSDSDNLTLQGAEVQAHTADLNVGTLTVASLQDTASSSNASQGVSAGIGFGQGSGVSSANAGYNQSNGNSQANQVNNQTQLLITDGENSQITAQHTSLIGGLIANATQDEDGNLTDLGQLNLTTDTLSVSHLEDRTSSQQQGFGLQTSVGIQKNEAGHQQASGGSTSINLQNQGHITEGLTQATLGGGNIQVGGKKLEDTDTPAGLNRDLSQNQITTLDQQTGGLNAGITVDHRLLSKDGWDEILNQQSDLLDNSKKVIGGVAGDLARVGAAAGSVLDLSLEQTTNAWDTAGKGQALAYTEDGQLAARAEDMRDGTLQDGQILQDGLQDIANFINPGDGQKVRITEGATTAEGRDVYGAAHEGSNTMFVDIADDRLNSLVNTVAHEGMHLNGAGETNATVTGAMTDFAYRINAWANNDQISEHRVKQNSPLLGIQDQAAHQKLLQDNNGLFRELDDRGELDYRQAPIAAISYIRDEGRVDRYMDLVNAGLPENEQLTREQAQQEMDRGLAAFEDDDWAAAHGRNEVFEDFLAQELANDPAGTFTDNHGQTHALLAPTEESRADSQAGLLTLFDEYGNNQQVNDYLGNLQIPVEGAAGLYQQGYSQGHEQAGQDFSIIGDATTLAQGLLGLPSYLYQSATSNEVGPLDDARMASYNDSLLLLQGRPGDAGFVAGYADSETARLTWLGTAASGGAGAILNRALGALARPDSNAATLNQNNGLTVTGAQWNTHLIDSYGVENVFWDWPKNKGFVYGADEVQPLQSGQLVGRHGSERGTFVSPIGTAPETLSLRPGTDTTSLNVYRVVKDIPDTRTGPAAPAFDMPGYGLQHELPDSVGRLVNDGYLERITK